MRLWPALSCLQEQELLSEQTVPLQRHWRRPDCREKILMRWLLPDTDVQLLKMVIRVSQRSPVMQEVRISWIRKSVLLLILADRTARWSDWMRTVQLQTLLWMTNVRQEPDDFWKWWHVPWKWIWIRWANVGWNSKKILQFPVCVQYLQNQKLYP